MKHHRLGALISVATALGLRLGEALGLEWRDVDFGAGTVRQALERSGGDISARRRLLLERRELRERFAAAPRRSIERRELRQQLLKLGERWEQRVVILRAFIKKP